MVLFLLKYDFVHKINPAYMRNRHFPCLFGHRTHKSDRAIIRRKWKLSQDYFRRFEILIFFWSKASKSLITKRYYILGQCTANKRRNHSWLNTTALCTANYYRTHRKLSWEWYVQCTCMFLCFFCASRSKRNTSVINVTCLALRLSVWTFG